MSQNEVPTRTTDRQRVLALGLDAPSHQLLLRWIGEGHLPQMKALQQASACFTVESIKRYSNEHCWIPFLTGRRRDRWAHWLDRWDADQYTFGEASIFDWLQAPVFYALGDRRRVIAFDLTAPVVPGVNGVQVSGWATELNEAFPCSAPPALMAQLLARYGPDPKLQDAQAIANSVSGHQGLSYSIPSLYQPGAIRQWIEGQLRSVERRTSACRDLMRSEPWDLFIGLYPEIHTAGHVLWHLSQPHPLNLLRERDSDPMLAIYRAVDDSLAELIAEAGADVQVLFFTIDEQVPDALENARAAILPEFLCRWNFDGQAALAQGRTGEAPPSRIDYDRHWKHEIWSLRTPWGEAHLQSPDQQEARRDPMGWCPANWYAPLWPAMRAFAMPSVADGYIRLNVRGREAQGKVEPGDFGAVCDEITAALATLVDARTGQPLVREVLRVRRNAFDTDPAQPPADLIAVFQDEVPVDTADSPRYGRIGPLPYFRTGSHQAHGQTLRNFAYVSGPGVQPGDRAGTFGLEDLPATILDLLGLDTPADFDGRSFLPNTLSGHS